MRTTAKTFRIKNHVLGRLGHLAADAGSSPVEVLEDLVNIATGKAELRELLRARAQSRALLDGIAQEYGRDAKIVFNDHGGGEVTVEINGEAPRELKPVVVGVEGHNVRILTLYHPEFGLRLQPSLPAATYADEPGATYAMSLDDLYPG